MTSRKAQELPEAAQEGTRSNQNLRAGAICAHVTGLRGIVPVDVYKLHSSCEQSHSSLRPGHGTAHLTVSEVEPQTDHRRRRADPDRSDRLVMASD